MKNPLLWVDGALSGVMALDRQQPLVLSDHSHGHAAEEVPRKSNRVPVHRHEHGPDGVPRPAVHLLVSSSSNPLSVNRDSELRWMLHDAEGNMLRRFEVVHEKLAHLILIREGADEFFHLHPAVTDSGLMTTEIRFRKAGKYFAFLDFQEPGGSSQTAHASLEVRGDVEPAAPLALNIPGRVISGTVHADVALQPTVDGSTLVSVHLLDRSGQPRNDLQSYLGARGHLVVASADSSRYFHTHPLASAPEPHLVEFELHLPGPGLYAAWAQFQMGDALTTIPLVFQL